MDVDVRPRFTEIDCAFCVGSAPILNRLIAQHRELEAERSECRRVVGRRPRRDPDHDLVVAVDGEAVEIVDEVERGVLDTRREREAEPRECLANRGAPCFIGAEQGHQ